MNWLMRWLRTMGTSGAVANARSLSAEREHEKEVVESLSARLAITDRKLTAA